MVTSENKTQTTIRVSKKIYQRIIEESEKLGISINAYITMVLSREITKGFMEENK